MAHQRYSREEIGKRGQEIYESQLRARVETPENIGKIISIDVDTGDYEIDDDLIKAGDRLRARQPGAHIYGLASTADLARRVPTVAITIDGHSPRALAEALGERGIFCWDGNYYALTLMERLGLEESGGALRIGLAHYNTADEVDRLLTALHEIVEG